MIYRRKKLDADPQTHTHTHTQTDRQTDRQTDISGYRVASTFVGATKKTVQSTVDSPLLAFGSRSVNARMILRNVVP